MASLADVLSEQEMTNWLKAWLAINITKTGLRDFVDKEVKSFQTSTIQSVAFNLRLPAITTCTCCLTANLLKCPTHKLCNKRKHNAVCKMHDTVSKQPRRCPNGICDAVREEIIKAHRYHSPSWNNTSAEQWASNHWELAKCYMPPDGYIAVSTFEETDFNGVISIILNCAIFDGQFSFSIAPQHPSPCCLLSKTRAIGKAVRHSSDCKVTSDDLCDYLLTLITLLSDSKVLVLDHSAQDAVRKLTQLQTEGLNISVAGVGQLLNDARESLKQAKQLSEESKTKLETYMQECITKLDKRVHNLQEKSEKDFRERTQTCTENCKRELSKHLKNSVISTQKTQPLMNECGVEQNIEEFRQRLINYYTKNVTHISLSSLMPSHVKSLVEIYAAPKICRIETEKDGTRKKTEWIKTYKGIFHSVQTTGKHIILQGEPGKGKSTFSSKLVVDWCNACNCAPQRTEQESTFGDAESLREFRFVFHVALRESRKQRKVVEMIKKQIIDMLYDDDHDVEKAYKLLLTILTKEACLVVEDGLDEWSDPDGKLPLPILVAPCVVFITTRPWKMCDELLKTSLVDCLLEIKGVIDPFVLSKSVLECLIDTNLDEKYDTFRSYIFANELTELIKTPLLLTLIVCLWVENSFLAGSACEIYSLLLDSLLKKSNSEIAYFHSPKFRCFKNTKYLKTNIGFIKSLSKAAFHLLFSELKENTLVFNDIELSKYLTKFEKMLALRTGILTEKKLSTLSYRPSTCSFIHKSVQEFLAALHIASNEDLVDSDILQQFNNGQIQLMEISQVFKFTCGLSITAANRLSRAFKIYADHAMMNRNLLDSYSGQSLQELIITGYKEAKANNVPGEEIHLQLNNFYSNFEERDTDTLNCIVLKNLSNIQSLEFTSNYLFSESFQHILTSCSSCTPLPSNTVSDRYAQQEITLGCRCEEVPCSAFDSLKLIVIQTSGALIPIIELRGLPNLESINLECQCTEMSRTFSEKRNMHVAFLPNALRGLPKLEKIRLGCNCDGLDLSACNMLREIELDKHVTLLPNALRGLRNLESIILKCKCDGLDLSGCNSLRKIKVGYKLILFEKNDERVKLLPDALLCLPYLESIELNCKCDGLDLSACKSLKNIKLGKKVILLPNALCGLPELEEINLKCECDGLDLFACNRLRTVELGKVCLYRSSMYINKDDEPVRLLPNALRGLPKLENITLGCTCDGLDLSECNSLRVIKVGKHVTFLPNTLRCLPRLEDITLGCICNGQDLFACNSIRKITLLEHAILLPNALRGLPNLFWIDIYCKCEGLDLSACNNLEIICLHEHVTLLPNALCGLQKVKYIYLQCVCDGLNLSACNSLSEIELGGHVTLLPNALLSLPNLEKIVLKCVCDGLDLSACERLCKVALGEHVTLIPNALRGLPKLEVITLECRCDGLDLSACYSVRNIELGEQVTLLPNALRGLLNLGEIYLKCKCNGLDLSACNSLEIIEIGEQVTLLPNTLPGLPDLRKIYLKCKCEGLDLSACNSLQIIELGEQVTLLLNTLRCLPVLEKIHLKCKFDGLDLSACNSLRMIELGEEVTLLQNALRGLPNLKDIKLKCKCDELDLSACNKIRMIVLGEQVTLLPNALRGLPDLEELYLKCKCEGLDLSACNRLWMIELGEQVALLPNTIRGLPYLGVIDLKCMCDGLDLSDCNSLYRIVLGEHVTLLPNALRGLPKLKEIKLKCKCDGLDLSACTKSRMIELGEQVTLLPNALRGLPDLEVIYLKCKCVGLDLTACKSLLMIELGEQVTLLPNTLRGLSNLAEINLKCMCDGLDLSACNRLWRIELGEQVTLLPNTLIGLPDLKEIILKCKCDGLDLSDCNSLRTIELGEQVTLLPNTLRGLPNLEKIY